MISGDSKSAGEPAPLVSVVMPVYNSERYLAEAIESILGQTFTDFEFIIVDDASTDSSAEIALEYARRDGRIRLLQREINGGAADARNSGIAVAEGEYIAAMDSDDVSLPARLEKQVDLLRSKPDIGGVGTQGHVVKSDLTPSHDFEAPVHHALIALSFFLRYGILGATIMLRREYLSAVGGYQPGRRRVDDPDLLARLLNNTQSRLVNLPDFLYLYRQYDRDPYPGGFAEERRLKLCHLSRLGIAEPEATLQRLEQLRPFHRLPWAERRRAKRDLMQIIDGMVAEGWVEPGDRTLLVAEMNRLLEQASPRIWQQFCHWRRRRFKRR